uniref:Uncharacterized protein n=1 Tax=Ditylenchus dipsaci TaxID=166011 RepID=A0A915D0M3_9BILA
MFNWRSSRPSVVAIEAVNPRASGCSDKALITSKSKFAKEESVVVYVENQGEGVSFSCDVTVDVIHSIAITTTTKVLYMDAAPARMVVEAINAEVTDSPLWDRYPLIGPFLSKMLESIEELEQKGKKGHVVLVEGLLSGSGQLTAVFSEPHFSHIQASGIELFAVANVMLVPSHDIYLPINALVKYGAIVQRKNHNEEIALPSPITPSKSVTQMCAISTQPTQWSLRKMQLYFTIFAAGVEKLKNIVKPRSARLYVVKPEKISYRIEPGNVWYLQKGLEYNIHLQLLDADGNVIHIPENAIFTTRMPETYVKVLEKSANNSYFRVQAIKTGKGLIKSAFESLVGQDGKVHRAQPVVFGERQVVVSDPVTLKAIGGTGHYHWTSSDVSVSKVNQSSGLVKSSGLGEAVVNVQDVSNHNHYDQAKIYVAEPYELHFGPSSQDSVVGSKLVLNLKLLAKTKAGIVPFTDCRHVPFKFSLGDGSVFAVDEASPSTIPESGAGCATVTLQALSPGETQLTAKIDRLTAEVDVTAFVSLTGIRIVPSSQQVDQGNLISAHIQGLTEDGSVFNFDDGLYPFDVTWKLSSADVAEIRSPVADFIDESPKSRFSINLHTLKSGQVTLAASVRADSPTSKNLYGKVHEFTHKVKLVVDEGLRFLAPELAMDTLRMTTKTNLKLAVNRKKTRFVVPSHYTPLLSIQTDKADTYNRSAKKEAQWLRCKRLDLQEIVHIRVDLPDSLVSGTETAKFLPKNTKLKLYVEFRDAAGRLFHAANSNTHYKFHRTDLLKVVASSNNRTFDVQLKGVVVVGESAPAVPVVKQQERVVVAPTTAVPDIKPVVKQPVVKTPQGSKIAHNPTAGEKAGNGLHAALSDFIESYNNVVVSTLVLIFSAILLVAGYRCTENGNAEGEQQHNYTHQTPMTNTPSHIAEISPIHDPTNSASDNNKNTWLSTDRPLFQSTPGSNSPAVARSGGHSGEMQSCHRPTGLLRSSLHSATTLRDLPDRLKTPTCGPPTTHSRATPRWSTDTTDNNPHHLSHCLD